MAGIHLIGGRGVASRRRVDPGRAVQRLTPEVAWPAGHERIERCLGVLAEMVTRVPVFELVFELDRPLWPLIAAAP